MATRVKQLKLATAILLLLHTWGCTDRRPMAAYPFNFNSPSLSQTSNYRFVGTITYKGNPTMISQMVVKGSTLFLTGSEVNFAGWNLADPENPTPSFTVREFMDIFSPVQNGLGFWTYGDLASGAIGIVGNYALLSGNKGMSIVNMGSAGSDTAVEQNRIPMPSNGVQPINPEATFKAIIPSPDPSVPVAWGFKQQDYVETLDISQLPYVKMVQAAPYSPNGPVCCVSNAALFQNHVVLAMTSKLWMFDVSGANLTNFVESTAVRAANVAATDKYLFIQNQPSGDPGLDNPSLNAGIYAVDATGQARAFYPIRPQVFAVYQNILYAYGDATGNAGPAGVDVYWLDPAFLP